MHRKQTSDYVSVIIHELLSLAPRCSRYTLPVSQGGNALTVTQSRFSVASRKVAAAASGTRGTDFPPKSIRYSIQSSRLPLPLSFSTPLSLSLSLSLSYSRPSCLSSPLLQQGFSSFFTVLFLFFTVRAGTRSNAVALTGVDIYRFSKWLRLSLSMCEVDFGNWISALPVNT